MKTFLLFLFLFIPTLLLSQKEILKYKIQYRYNFIWLNAGECVFQKSDTFYYNQKCTYYKVIGSSYNSISWLYNLKDTLLSINSNKLLFSETKRNEDNYHKYERYKYTYNYASYVIENSKEKYDTIKSSNSYDPITMCYKLRTYNYSKLKPTDRFTITILVDGKERNSYVKYVGFKDSCYIFTCYTFNGNLFQTGESLEIYIKNDKNHTPVLIKGKVRVGYIVATLEK